MSCSDPRWSDELLVDPAGLHTLLGRWVAENSVPDDAGGALIRQPVRANIGAEWMDLLEWCCKCGRATTSGIYIRVDPATVRYPTPEEET